LSGWSLIETGLLPTDTGGAAPQPAIIKARHPMPMDFSFIGAILPK
jgi:hypothetical protein